MPYKFPAFVPGSLYRCAVQGIPKQVLTICIGYKTRNTIGVDGVPGIN